MRAIDISFIILHYNAIKETNDLIHSIKTHIDTSDYLIVVIDNCSPNNSGIVLQDKYKNDSSIIVILIDNNLGFARGNNVGIDFVRRNYTSKYICCLNNDTLLIQKNFFQMINREFMRSNAAIIGPKGYLKNGDLQYSAYKMQSLTQYRNEHNSLKKGLILPKDKLFIQFLKEKTPHIFRLLINIKFSYINPGLFFRKEDVVLHGSCIIFTPSFFEKLNGFNPKTFLYREEELLYLSVKKEKLLSVYNPKIIIKHLEDVATDSILLSQEEKNSFIKKYQIESLGILIDEMERMYR